MSWLSNLIDRYNKRKLKKLNRSKRHIRDFVDIDRAKSVGFVVNMNQYKMDDIKLLRSYIGDLKKQQKNIVLVELNFEKKSEPQFRNSVNAIFINPSKLNILEHPKAAIENQLQRHQIDILINLDFSEKVTSKFVCSMANARTRTGKREVGYEDCYELMIEMPENNGLKKTLREYSYFLQMLEK